MKRSKALTCEAVETFKLPTPRILNPPSSSRVCPVSELRLHGEGGQAVSSNLCDKGMADKERRGPV